MVVSTLPSNTFLGIDILVEFFTAWEIPVSTADPDCLPEKNARNEKPETTMFQTKPDLRNIPDKKNKKFSYHWNISILIY